MPEINRYLANVSPVSSNAISQAAKKDPTILNLSIGEPDFGPPPHLLEDISKQDLLLPHFIDAVKRYEHSRGSQNLRQAVAAWYRRCYGLRFDWEHEIMITHGGIEALNLALLTVTNPSDRVVIADPGYTLYARMITVTGREVVPLPRPKADHEYVAALDRYSVNKAKAILVNSPENPTGYVMSTEDWKALSQVAEREDCWVIQDEVYDVMAFSRTHQTARSIPGLEARSMLVNSCSKKFGIPGLRIGWLIADQQIIDAATKVHEGLVLGVNILAELIATRLLNDGKIGCWLDKQRAELARRNQLAIQLLNHEQGFQWPRFPMGGLFLFPDVHDLYERLPARYHQSGIDAGSTVAHYFLKEQQIATVPGAAYGSTSRNHIRVTNCGSPHIFETAIHRLAFISRSIVDQSICLKEQRPSEAV